MNTQQETNRKYFWNLGVPRALNEALEEALKSDTHATKADFIRDSVRRKLEDIGFKPQVFEKKQEVPAQ